MEKSVVFLDENEIDNRIEKAIANLKINSNRKIYGVSGLGNQNSLLTRTYDAAGIDFIVESKDGVNIDCYAKNNETFNEFFNFKPYYDELGNAFVTITPKSFKIDRETNGEITAISVKEYEIGDEERGYEPHSFFKKWTNETEWDEIISRDVAVFLSSSDNKNGVDVITSKPGLEYGYEYYKSLLEVRNAIQNTNPRYGIVDWMYLDFFRLMCVIYFGRTDLMNMINFPFIKDESGYCSEDEYIVGDNMPINNRNHHTFFNKEYKHFTIFNISNALVATYIDRCKYIHGEGFYYTHLFEFDPDNAAGYIKSNTTTGINSYIEPYGAITKLRYDTTDSAFKLATSSIKLASFGPHEESPENLYCYYSGKQRIDVENLEVGKKLFCCAFAKHHRTLYPDHGIFTMNWNTYFGLFYLAVRLCKSPF